MYSKRIERAIRLAVQAHAGQIRKADPDVHYVTHPYDVSLMVLAAGGDEDCVIAALLHDVLEDTEVTPEDLEDSFGARVTSIVRDVSEDKTLPWSERKARMVEQLRTAPPDACLVAAVDKIHNLETLIEAHGRFGPGVWVGFRGGPAQTVRFYEEVLNALRDRLPPAVAAAFERAMEGAHRLVAPVV